MKLEDLSEKQRRDLSTFDDFLSAHGWHSHGNSRLLRSGFTVAPEGRGSLETESSDLSLQIFLEEDVLLLGIESKTEGGRFELGFHYGANLAELLAWVAVHQATLTQDNFARPTKETLAFCDEVVFRTDDGNMYDLSLEDEDA